MRLALIVVLLATGCGGESEGDGGGSGGGSNCEAFLDDPPETGTTVVIRNQTSQTLYVTSESTCTAIPPFTLTDSAGQAVPLGIDTCGSSCEALQQHEPYGCPASCMMPLVVRIEPNGSYAYPWTRAVLESVAMPDACWFSDERASDVCSRVIELAQGSYTLTASAGTECVGCICTPDALGSCLESVGTVTGETLSASAEVGLPSTSVEVAFQ